jgi:hypothetical protein
MKVSKIVHYNVSKIQKILKFTNRINYYPWFVTGLMRRGMARYGNVRQGGVWYGEAGYGMAGSSLSRLLIFF